MLADVTTDNCLENYIPEMERAVTTGSRERAVCWVEGDGIDAKDIGDVSARSRSLSMALKREVETITD